MPASYLNDGSLVQKQWTSLGMPPLPSPPPLSRWERELTAQRMMPKEVL
jgi:hypothetical protein